MGIPDLNHLLGHTGPSSPIASYEILGICKLLFMFGCISLAHQSPANDFCDYNWTGDHWKDWFWKFFDTTPRQCPPIPYRWAKEHHMCGYVKFHRHKAEVSHTIHSPTTNHQQREFVPTRSYFLLASKYLPWKSNLQTKRHSISKKPFVLWTNLPTPLSSNSSGTMGKLLLLLLVLAALSLPTVAFLAPKLRVHSSPSAIDPSSVSKTTLSLSGGSNSNKRNDAFPKSRTDLRIFLTQRSIQSFVYLLNQCREDHTVRWLEVRKLETKRSAGIVIVVIGMISHCFLL